VRAGLLADLEGGLRHALAQLGVVWGRAPTSRS